MVDTVDITSLTDEELARMETAPPADPELEDDTVPNDISEESITEDVILDEDSELAEVADSAPVEYPGLEDPVPTNVPPQAAEEQAQPDSPQDGGADQSAADGSGQEQVEDGIDYKSAYEQIMAPFNASGQTMSVKNTDEVIRLMQQGAHFTKKMQALAPSMKALRMLQKNNLMDQDKLNYLIDLDQRKPEAIQKLLHEAKLDPLDINIEDDPQYTPTNHAISDEENNFRSILEDVSSTPTGQETIQHINNEWDQGSQEAVLKEPQLLHIINEQRSNGIYDKIYSEVVRQKTLGYHQNVPFLDAYKTVGDALQAQGALAPAQPQAATPTPQPQVLETRPARSVANPAPSAQVRAAAQPQTQPKPAKKHFDPFSMSDAEIEAMVRPPS